MQISRFIYQDNPNYLVEFEPASTDNVMVNATMMAAIFDREVFQFTRIDDTKNFIKACLKPQNCGLLGIKNKEDLIISKQKSGTWMHRILALKFAAWLDSDFEVWVYTTIDLILNQYYREQRDARLEKLRLKNRKETLKNKFLLKYPDFAEYVELEELEKESDKKLLRSVKKQMHQLRLDFSVIENPELS